MVSYKKTIKRDDPKAESKFEAKIPNFLSYFFWDKVINLNLVERITNGIGAIVSKFVENEYFKKAIGMNLLYDQFRYKDYEFFKGLVEGMGFTED